MSEFSYLWNDLPDEERKHLMPFLLEEEKTALLRARKKMVTGHKKALREIDEVLKSIERDLDKHRLNLKDKQ